jgi:hypothetical protein
MEPDVMDGTVSGQFLVIIVAAIQTLQSVSYSYILTGVTSCLISLPMSAVLWLSAQKDAATYTCIKIFLQRNATAIAISHAAKHVLVEPIRVDFQSMNILPLLIQHAQLEFSITLEQLVVVLLVELEIVMPLRIQLLKDSVVQVV